MKRKFSKIVLCFCVSLTLFAACRPAVLPATQTPTMLPTSTPITMMTDTPCEGLCPGDSITATVAMGSTMTANSSTTPVCEGLCLSDSMTATAAMGLTFAAIPSNTPPPGATIIPSAGDLGWGAIYGQILDGVTGHPIQGATVKCEHSSYTSAYLCNGTTTTDSNGAYMFRNVFFHDTDRINLTVEAPGYATGHLEQDFFTRPEFLASLGLFPATDITITVIPTPVLMCTPPVCQNGTLVCGNSNGCPGGCGTICLPLTPTP